MGKRSGNVDRRFVVSMVITLAAMPLVAGILGIGLAWCLHRWNTPVWVLGIASFGLVCGGYWLTWRLARKLTAGRLAFRMRAMLVGVTVVAVVMSTVGRWFLGTYRQQQALRRVVAFGGDIYEFDIRASDPRSWLYRLIGYDPFEGVQGLEIRSDEALSAAIEQADHFADVEILSFLDNFSAAGLRHAGEFNKFPNLRVGEFMESSVDGDGLQHLAKWANHKELFFNGCPNVTDASLRHLVDLPNLKRLSLVEQGGGMAITDAGLAHVGRMKNLKRLMIIGMPQVTDAGLTSLHGLSKLEQLVVRKTAATENGVAQLYQALPDCCVFTDVYVPGPANVRKIVVSKIDGQPAPVSVISDPDRIGKFRKLLRLIDDTGQQIDDRDRQEPMPAKLRLEFKGRARTLHEVRLGHGTLQRSRLDQWGWTKWQLSDEQESLFLELLADVEER
jgi:hypothetical protein